MKTFLRETIQASFRSGFPSISLKEKVFNTAFVGLGFSAYSPFFETFNEKIDQMISAGLIEG